MSQEHNESAFVPPPPPQPSIGNPMYPPDVLTAKAKEASDNIRTALIFGGIGLLCFGFIFGFLGFRRARQATEIIDQYDVVKDKRSLATGAKVLGIVDIVGWAVALLSRFYFA